MSSIQTYTTNRCGLFVYLTEQVHMKQIKADEKFLSHEGRTKTKMKNNRKPLPPPLFIQAEMQY